MKAKAAQCKRCGSLHKIHNRLCNPCAAYLFNQSLPAEPKFYANQYNLIKRRQLFFGCWAWWILIIYVGLTNDFRLWIIFVTCVVTLFITKAVMAFYPKGEWR